LDELYNMTAIEENEYTPNEFSKQLDFFLPDGDYSELIRKKEEDINKEQSFIAPAPTTTNRALSRRKRRDSGETHSSRSSTPASARDLRKS
uniref:FH2 domain-containing protein n=1 Tax=Anisakis simplex TaxID=6269 RepID=A0A0M3KJM5_ANISI